MIEKVFYRPKKYTMAKVKFTLTIMPINNMIYTTFLFSKEYYYGL